MISPIRLRRRCAEQQRQRHCNSRVLQRKIDKAVQPRSDFEPDQAQRVFRIMASDYGEATLFPAVLAKLRDLAPGITLDIMTPSDVSFLDVERGKVDMVINRFDSMPQSFHQIHLWDDTFSCILNVDHPMLENFTLDNYLVVPEALGDISEDRDIDLRAVKEAFSQAAAIRCLQAVGAQPQPRRRAVEGQPSPPRQVPLPGPEAPERPPQTGASDVVGSGCAAMEASTSQRSSSYL